MDNELQGRVIVHEKNHGGTRVQYGGGMSGCKNAGGKDRRGK
jgi:hypothetical protein